MASIEDNKDRISWERDPERTNKMKENIERN
jgi:hypothetical protein